MGKYGTPQTITAFISSPGKSSPSEFLPPNTPSNTESFLDLPFSLNFSIIFLFSKEVVKGCSTNTSFPINSSSLIIPIFNKLCKYSFETQKTPILPGTELATFLIKPIYFLNISSVRCFQLEDNDFV